MAASKKLKEIMALHDEDRFAWMVVQIRMLKSLEAAEDNPGLDWKHLIEMLHANMTKEIMSIKTQLTVIMANMLQREHQPVEDLEPILELLQAEIVSDRLNLEPRLTVGVRAQLTDDVMDSLYEPAVLGAIAATKLPRVMFPMTRAHTLNDLLGGGRTIMRTGKAH